MGLFSHDDDKPAEQPGQMPPADDTPAGGPADDMQGAMPPVAATPPPVEPPVDGGMSTTPEVGATPAPETPPVGEGGTEDDQQTPPAAPAA